MKAEGMEKTVPEYSTTRWDLSAGGFCEGGRRGKLAGGEIGFVWLCFWLWGVVV